VKKLNNLFAALVIVLSGMIAPIVASVTQAGASIDSSGFTYEILSSTSIEVTGCPSCSGVVTIPSTINGIPVTTLGSYSDIGGVTGTPGHTLSTFRTGQIDLLTIPNTVTSFNGAWQQQVRIANIVFAPGSTITSIPGFWMCNNGNLRSITLPDQLRSIGDYAFVNSGVTSIYLPATMIGVNINSALSGSPQLTYAPATHTVTYALNGGTGSLPTQASSPPGTVFTINPLSFDPVKADFAFNGWSDGTSLYQDGSSYTMGATAVVFSAQWRVSQAPAPVGLAQDSFGSPVSAGVSLTQVTNVALSSGGTTSLVSVPIGALPAGTTISAFPVVKPGVVPVPTGQSYVTSIIVTWLAPDGSSPTATAPLTLTITDPAIKKGDNVYQIESGVVTFLGTALQDGSALVSFSVDPVLAVTHVIPPIIYSKPTAPSNVTASMSNGTATVSFTPGTSGNLPTYNQIDMLINGQSVSNVCNVTGASSCPIANLGPDAAFSFTVTAINSKGSVTSSVSNVVSYASPTTVPPTTTSTTTTTTTTMPLAKQTITCVKGKIAKKVTAARPVCPAGFKKK